jgi:hypothetical protein
MAWSLRGPATAIPELHRQHQVSQVSAAISRSHSSGSSGLRARKLIPSVPNFAALDAWGASANTSARQVISNPVNPAATTVA